MSGLNLEPTWALAITTFISAILAYAGIRFTARGSIHAARIGSEGPNWSSFTERITKRLEAVEEENDELRSRVEAVESQLASLRRLYRHSIRYIQALRAWMQEQGLHVDTLPPVPPVLLPDVEDETNGGTL